MKKVLASIIITCFNKDRFIKNTIQSAINQKYITKEIIVYDDNSNDRSMEFIKEFKNIKILKNNLKKKKSGPLNQINAIIRSFLKSKGEFIFFLDGDDEFKKNKIKKIIDLFRINKKFDLIQDKPYLIKKKKIINLKIKRNFFSIWPSVYPTSCIAVRRKFFKNFLRYSEKNKYNHLEIDARLVMFSFLKKKNLLINRSYTNYHIDNHGITSGYRKFSKNWWKKRKDAFEYFKFLHSKLNLTFLKGSDYYFTKFLNFLLIRIFGDH